MIHTYTSAPVDYDGFGTRTVSVAGKDQRGRDIRLVATPEPPGEWQRQRYHSGTIYLVVDEAEFKKLVAYGFVVPTEAVQP